MSTVQALPQPVYGQVAGDNKLHPIDPAEQRCVNCGQRIMVTTPLLSPAKAQICTGGR